MTAIVEIDKAGRIVIPKKMRDAMGLASGSRLRVECAGDRLVIEPPVEEARLEMRDGLLVLVGGGRRTVEDVNREIQEQRERRIQFAAGLSDEP
jgi:AbrB family looped-hinge helix DNA binding protein